MPICSFVVKVQAHIVRPQNQEAGPVTESERIKALLRYVTYMNAKNQEDEHGNAVTPAHFEQCPTQPFVITLPLFKINSYITNKMYVNEWAYMVTTSMWMDLLSRVPYDCITDEIWKLVHARDKQKLSQNRDATEPLGPGVAAIIGLLLDCVCFPIKKDPMPQSIIDDFNCIINELKGMQDIPLVSIMSTLIPMLHRLRCDLFSTKFGHMYSAREYGEASNALVEDCNKRMMLDGMLSGLSAVTVFAPKL